MVVLGVTAIVELGSVAGRADYLGTNSLPSVVKIGQVGGDVANFRRYQNRLVWAAPNYRAHLLAGMRPYAVSANTTLASYDGLCRGPRPQALGHGGRRVEEVRARKLQPSPSPSPRR